MDTKLIAFGKRVAQQVAQAGQLSDESSDQIAQLSYTNTLGQTKTLNLIPLRTSPQPADAGDIFQSVHTTEQLIDAYHQARASKTFEWDIAQACQQIDPFAQKYLRETRIQAMQALSNTQALHIAQWAAQLDLYCAVKSIESLAFHPAGVQLLNLGNTQQWDIHFDHVAIRCGSQDQHAGQRIQRLLCEEHGYTRPQLADQHTYRFEDGWNAYPVYKLLDNGQMLRVFIDESATGHPQQIIQHWHRVYGYSAHHLALRATKLEQGQRHAIPLATLSSHLEQLGIPLLSATGLDTAGLLEQVFTRPCINTNIPAHILDQVNTMDKQLGEKLKNAMLLELVSRTELGGELAQQWATLYGLDAIAQSHNISAPVYHYFLPAQAAHVIATSLQTDIT